MNLPSVHPSTPALDDVSTTKDQIQAAMSESLGKVTSPEQTPIFICTTDNCNRLFPNRDRLVAHRKRDHPDVDADDVSTCLTWNTA
ncbi:hypothetical protein BKA70DRAFT_1250910 [Coprinopsis sp. MPI-PUGE-AT-0042]|nr:hypothetical protein BKA70DRAFT_1250910 [Coprinopsis sp. MPI-PUGE-AT-0042]